MLPNKGISLCVSVQQLRKSDDKVRHHLPCLYQPDITMSAAKWQNEELRRATTERVFFFAFANIKINKDGIMSRHLRGILPTLMLLLQAKMIFGYVPNWVQDRFMISFWVDP